MSLRSTLPVTVFRPDTGRPAAIAGGGAALALLLTLGLAVRGVVSGFNFAGFASFVLAGVLIGLAGAAGYWALALVNLRYELGDGALTIVWGLTRQVVPLANVERVVRGRSLGLPRVHGLDLPGWGCHVGRGQVPRVGDVLFYSTHRAPSEILYLVTPNESYGISPINPQGLIGALQASVADSGQELRQEVLRHPLANLPAWSDRLAVGVTALAVVLALAATGVVFSRYTGIPSRTILSFPNGDHPGNKTALLGIPATAFALLLLNLVAALVLHRPLRPVAYTLLLGGAFVQSLLLVAAITAT
jgi:hypothetical protein